MEELRLSLVQGLVKVNSVFILFLIETRKVYTAVPGEYKSHNKRPSVIKDRLAQLALATKRYAYDRTGTSTIVFILGLTWRLCKV